MEELSRAHKPCSGRPSEFRTVVEYNYWMIFKFKTEILYLNSIKTLKNQPYINQDLYLYLYLFIPVPFQLSLYISLQLNLLYQVIDFKPPFAA